MSAPSAEPGERTRRRRGAWRRAANRAAESEGAISLQELRACGLSGRQVWHASRTGRLHRRFRGVYLLGHPFATARARLFCAVKACGADAVVSHVSAADFWGLLEWSGRLHVIVPRRRRPRPHAVLTTASLDLRREVTHRRGFAVTTLPRTFADCAEVLAEPVLRRMVEAADQQGRLTPRMVRTIHSACAGRPGEQVLCRLLDERDPGSGRPRSWLEGEWARFAKRWDLPAYERGGHIDIGGLDLREMDVYFAPTETRGPRLIELDGFGTHGRTKTAFERDRRRDRRLIAMGTPTMRVTEADLVKHEVELAEDAHRFLGNDERADAIARGEWRPTT